MSELTKNTGDLIEISEFNASQSIVEAIGATAITLESPPTYQIEYEKWCKDIAESQTTSDLIAHFREHVWSHYDRHDRLGETSIKIWVIGVLNFMHLLAEKFPDITTEDLLFKLCTYHKNHPGRTEPDFDMNRFLTDFDGEIKEFHKETLEP
jgi:hypothetical protein